MSINEYLIKMIDRVEYYVTKEIERNIYGTGDECYIVLYDRIVECLKARRTIDHQPCQNVETLLRRYGYGDDFINRFLFRTYHCINEKADEDTLTNTREHLVVLTDIFEHYLLQKIRNINYDSEDKYYLSYFRGLVDCINARKEIDYKPYNNVEALLKDHDCSEILINKFITEVHRNENQSGI